MNKYTFAFAIGILSCLLLPQNSSSEPWLSNRYAENCAACHAPGRLNRPAPGRRCTLSCQGCHVNPQGGGMRNQYGIWNQQRWLRSMRTEMFRDKPTPAPFDRQPYADRVKALASRASQFYGGRRPQSEVAKRVRPTTQKAQPVRGGKGQRPAPAEPERGEELAQVPDGKGGKYTTRWLKDVDPPLRLYDKNSYDEWYAVVEDEADLASVIPEGDPYHRERELSVYASGDFRYFALNADKTTVLSGKKQRTFLMGADVGVRLRPTKYHQLSAVVEGRFANSPTGEDPEDGFTSQAQAKSAYLIVDDLPYNSFVQAGLYRPMFGHYDTDHNSLSSEVTGLTQTALLKGFGFGIAPNVPFLVANYIQPYKKDGNEHQTSDGFVVTAGGRFVTYGASVALSYWKTNFTSIGSAVENSRNMIALTAGGTVGRFIANFETVRVEKSNSTGAKNAGNVNTFQGKARLFRENYAVLNYGFSNVARDVSKGSGTETMVGFKSFPISNLELEALYVMRKYKENNASSGYNMIQVQAHVFF